MEYWGISIRKKRVFWLNFKKHACPACGAQLEKIQVAKIVDPCSEEAKEFDFSEFPTNTKRCVKFIWEELSCHSCNIRYPIDEIYHIEQHEKYESCER